MTPVAEIEIVLLDQDIRKHIPLQIKEKLTRIPLYADGESVIGKVQVRVRDGKRLDHQGIKVEFVGIIGILSSTNYKNYFTIEGIIPNF